jgi:hypothetical protein
MSFTDNPQGDFSVRPPRGLEAGTHTLIAYAELPDGTRSAAKILKFKIDPATAQRLSESNGAFNLFNLKNIILTLLFINFSFLAFYLRKNKTEMEA